MSDLKPVSFFVPGEAIGKGRPRVSTIGGHARMFTPKKTANYETLIAMAAQQAMNGRELIAGPVMMELAIRVAVAASWSKKKSAAALAGDVMPTKKPDADNVLKAICDGINGIVFKDDVQVVNVSLSKRFSATPGVTVKVVPLVGGVLMKPLLQWACRELNDGWVMIGVDVDLSAPGEPEMLMGLRRAVHPFQFDEAENPVMEFIAVITEMDFLIRRGCGVSAQPHFASRARAFGG